MNESGLNYELAYQVERVGTSFGCKILIAAGRPLVDEEKQTISRIVDSIEDVVMTETISQDEIGKAIARTQRELLIRLFPAPIYVEQVPNGYCKRWCCKHLPWFIVTTTKGRVTIGWRKRVIEISWEEPVAPTALKLFSSENVTMGERYIHAWGYDKAREYVAKLMSGGAA